MKLKRGYHFYVVYLPNDMEGIIQARNQNEAEKIAKEKYGTIYGVAYTEL